MGKLKRGTDQVRKAPPAVRRSQKTAELETSRDSPTATRHAELLALERKQFAKSGQEARVERALEALKGLRVDFELDPETVRWIAQDIDIEEF